MLFGKLSGICCVLIALAGCSTTTKRESTPALGVAYAGPATLNLRKDIDPKSPVVTVVHHGDKLEIVGQRRRSWYRVRTATGVVGWTGSRELLDSAQMQRLHALATETEGMPSQGVATTFSTVNVHTEPMRQSTSFVQVHEHEKFDTIAHRVVPRTTSSPARELIPPKPKIVKAAKKSNVKDPLNLPPLPAPPVPGPPADWLALSTERGTAETTPQSAAEPVKTDDWTLIRTQAGQSGWVLTSSIYLLIPDEVAQYAEGHRITSYFSVGKIPDGDLQKDIWLWTTAERLGEDHDFDSYRVFVWSLRHHRYETAYIQRRERGFFPVIAKTGEFSVCLERTDGSRARIQYTMLGNAVHQTGEKPCEKMQVIADEPQEPEQADYETTPAPRSLEERIKDRVKGLFKRR